MNIFLEDSGEVRQLIYCKKTMRQSVLPSENPNAMCHQDQVKGLEQFFLPVIRQGSVYNTIYQNLGLYLLADFEPHGCKYHHAQREVKLVTSRLYSDIPDYHTVPLFPIDLSFHSINKLMYNYGT